MDAGTWRGIFTLLMLLLFVGICLWAWSGRRKPDFDEASRLPLAPDAAPPAREPAAGDSTRDGSRQS